MHPDASAWCSAWLAGCLDPCGSGRGGGLGRAAIGTGLVLAQEEPDTNGKILLANAYNPSGPEGPTVTGTLLVIDVKEEGPITGHHCGHWSDTHPKWRAGGFLALAHYEWGTRFLDVLRVNQD